MRIIFILKRLGFILSLTATFLAAQNGDRGHRNMNSVVPEDLIPPAPVLSVEEALKTFTLAEGFIIEPVAAEPLVEKPVALKFDGNGRIWVVEMLGYMNDLDGSDEDQPQGRIVVLEDTDNDGQADKRTIFLDNILLPRAIALVKDGILIGDEYNLSFCGRDGIKRTSDPVIVDEKFAPSGNVEHKPNTLLPHLNNWLYCAKGNQRYRWKDGKLLKNSTEFRGQWGLSMDNFGRIYSTSNSITLRGDRLLPETIETFRKAKLHSNTSVPLGTNQIYPIRVNPGLNRAYISIANGYDTDTLDPQTHKAFTTTATAGVDFYRGDQFPDSWQNVAFSADSGAHLVKATRVHANGLELTGKHVFPDSEFLASTDERFRPVNLHTAPDGSLYLVDYYHGIIQHKIYMTSYLRAQYESRGLHQDSAGLGRIYRIRHKDAPLGPQPQLLDASSKELVKTLAHPNGWWRDTAQRLLVERNDPESLPLLKELLKNPSEKHMLAQLHALWVLEGTDQLADDSYSKLFNWGTPEPLRIHALNAAMNAPSTDSAHALIESSQIGKNIEPYVLRYLAQFSPHSKRLRSANFRPPFAAEATATGLLSQGVTGFPKTNSRLDTYLQNAKRDKVIITPEERLNGEHLNAYNRGRKLYRQSAACINCHGGDGAGMPNLGPPLDESEWVTGDPKRLAKILLHGLKGPITVNGIKYNPAAAMPGLSMNPTIKDADIADVMTYIRAEWSNKAEYVEVKTVTDIRAATKDRKGKIYTVEELN